jgi:hypothetical protein
MKRTYDEMSRNEIGQTASPQLQSGYTQMMPWGNLQMQMGYPMMPTPNLQMTQGAYPQMQMGYMPNHYSQMQPAFTPVLMHTPQMMQGGYPQMQMGYPMMQPAFTPVPMMSNVYPQMPVQHYNYNNLSYFDYTQTLMNPTVNPAFIMNAGSVNYLHPGNMNSSIPAIVNNTPTHTQEALIATTTTENAQPTPVPHSDKRDEEEIFFAIIINDIDTPPLPTPEVSSVTPAPTLAQIQIPDQLEPQQKFEGASYPDVDNTDELDEFLLTLHTAEETLPLAPLPQTTLSEGFLAEATVTSESKEEPNEKSPISSASPVPDTFVIKSEPQKKSARIIYSFEPICAQAISVGESPRPAHTVTLTTPTAAEKGASARPKSRVDRSIRQTPDSWRESLRTHPSQTGLVPSTSKRTHQQKIQEQKAFSTPGKNLTD